MAEKADVVRGRGKNKRMWSSHEEKALVDILEELQNSVWKCDTGYKTGYLQHIEKKMSEKFPRSNLKGKPHIESKIKLLKRQLNYILEIQKSGSGFGWNDEEKMIVGDKDVFMGWAKGRDGAQALYNRPFPLFDSLCAIYANDKADGSKAKGPGDGLDESSNNNSKEDDFDIESTTTSKRERKRKRDEIGLGDGELSDLSKAITSLVDVEKESAALMVDMKKSFLREVEIGEKRSQIFNVLMGFSELSQDEVVEAVTAIGLDDKKVELFFSMPDNFKLRFAKA